MGITENKDPFPHWVVRNYWDDNLLENVVREVPPVSDPRWQQFDNSKERKLGMSDRSGWGPATRQVMDMMLSPAFAAWLSDTTDIPELVGKVEGGGIHRIRPGGVLGTHVDFNRSSDDGMHRRLNCLLYLNEGWTEEDGGHLELRQNADDPEPEVRILPERNTMVIFETSRTSWHGHPDPLPGPKERLSLACYFYTDTPPEHVSAPHSTIFSQGVLDV